VIFWPRDPIRIRRNALARGNKYAAEKKIPEAIIEYRTALQADPRFGEAHARLADAYAQMDDARNAFIEYVTAADLLPNDVPAQLRAGSALLLMGFAKEAGDRADRVLAIDPLSLDAKILRANVTAGLKNLDDAVAQMYAVSESVADKPSDQARVLLHLGVMELARGHKNDAEGLLRKASSRESASVTNHLALANYYWALGRHEEGEAELKRVLEIDPHEPRANRALSALYIATDRVPAAEEPLKVLAASSTEPGARFVLADYYIVTKRVGEATTILKEMTRDTAFYAQAQLRLALIEYEAGRLAQADQIIDATLRTEPTHPTVLLMKARMLAERRRFDEALQRVNAALAVEPKSVEAQYLLGTILTARNEPAEAIAAFNQVLKLRPTLVDALVRLSTLHLARSDPDTAARFAVQAVTNAPTNGAARIALVRALLSRGNVVEAERELKPLFEANTGSPVVLTQWGRLLALKHDAAGARRSLREAIRLDPASLEPLAELVSVELAAGRPADAMPLVEARLAKAPDEAPALLLAARIYAVQGQSASQEMTLKRVIEVDPSNIRAFGALGQFYYAAGRIPEARRHFEELARQKSNSVGAFTMLAMIQELDGKPADAEKTYEHALALDGNAAVAANNLAWLQVRRGGNLDVALQLAKTAKAAFPNEPEFNDTLGWIYVQKQLPELGLLSLLDSVRAVPDNASFRFHLGMAYVARAEHRLARAHLERALLLRQDFEGADEAKRKVEWLRQLPTDVHSDESSKVSPRSESRP
jgi:tetratricopeptide (TPR) repeat protein